jgi:RimJ/RimL family protein N-acetyltransferase
MQIKSITENELDAFISIDENPKLKESIQSMWKEGISKPEWCFVAEKDNKYTARIAYWKIEDDRLSIAGLHLPWIDDDYAETGKKLVKESIKSLIHIPNLKIESRLSDDNPVYEKLKVVLKESGFENVQGKYRFVINKEDLVDNRSSQKLHYKSLKEAGRKKFIEAIKIVTRNTLDKEDLEEVNRIGEDAHAENYFKILKEIDYRPEIWFLAYTEEGDFAGLVVPQVFNNDCGCINYIGVNPDFRGKGYSSDLISKADRTLFNDESVDKIIAEVDSENYPLEKNLSSAGYKKDSTMYRYVMKL